MRAILEQPFGRFLLTAVALGFIAFGLCAFLRRVLLAGGVWRGQRCQAANRYL